MSNGTVTVAEFQALFRLRDALQTAESTEQILEAVCDAVEDVLGVGRVSVQVFSGTGPTRFLCARGLSDPYRKLIEERWRSIFDPDRPQTFISPHIQGDDREPLWREIVAEGIRSLISVPLMGHGRLLGKMVAYHDQPHSFSRHEIDLAEMIANVAAITVARQQSDDARREAQEELKAYHDLLTHDVTNFAGTLSGIVEYLLSQPQPAAHQELLRRANRQLFQLTRLADNAKNLSRIREKGLDPSGRPVDLGDLMTRMAETVRSAHFDRPLQVETECPPGLRVPGIPFLDHVFLNLFDNIVRHTPAGQSPRVRIRVAPEDGRVRIAIRGGPPPDERTLKHLFERYQPGARSTGSGLGLALIREIVSRSGGDVQVGVSSESDGQAFEVLLTLPSART